MARSRGILAVGFQLHQRQKNCCLNQDLPTNRLFALLKTPGPDPAENIRRSLATSNLIGLKSRGFWGQSNKCSEVNRAIL